MPPPDASGGGVLRVWGTVKVPTGAVSTGGVDHNHVTGALVGLRDQAAAFDAIRTSVAGCEVAIVAAATDLWQDMARAHAARLVLTFRGVRGTGPEVEKILVLCAALREAAADAA